MLPDVGRPTTWCVKIVCDQRFWIELDWKTMSPRVTDWNAQFEKAKRAEWFDVAADDFAVLEIREANPRFSYFYDSARRVLIKRFLLRESAQVALLCEVRLVAKDGRYSPRVRLLKVDKTKSFSDTTEEIGGESMLVKASVDTDGGHEEFMRLMSYVLSLKEVDAGGETFQLSDASDAEIMRALKSRDRDQLLPLIGAMLESTLTEREINLISDRKTKIEYFDRMLNEEGFFEQELLRTEQSPEALWQSFFEDASWIFGYGLSLITHDGLGGKLEQITTGANIWSGAGKRVDAVMRSRAVISTLLFCEIKRHDTPLLKTTAYRQPDVYVASNELVGGVAQLQKTVRKAYQRLIGQIHNQTTDDGTPTGLDFSTTRARQVLVVGNLQEFRIGGGVNGEKMESFELFRKANADVEVVTFDELLARAKFIVSG